MKQQTQLFVDTTVAHGVTVSAPMNGYQPSRFGAATAAAPPSQQPWDENQGAINHNNPVMESGRDPAGVAVVGGTHGRVRRIQQEV